ncbi:MAG: hypothetical protein Tsb0021_04960 [Chlamydiales bacterium]
MSVLSRELLQLTRIEKMRSSWLGLPSVLGSYFQKNLSSYDVVICNGEFGYKVSHPHCINLFHGSALGYRRAVRRYLGPRSYLKLRLIEYYQKRAALKKTVVCVSDYLKNIYENDGTPVHAVIANGVDTDLFTRQDIPIKDKYLFVGSYDFVGKGFDILQQIAEKGMNIDCVTKQHSLDNLGWLPQVSHTQMPAVYSRYKLFLFPSRFEGMSVAPLEAMSCGLPVVISPIGLGPQLKRYIPEFVANGYDAQEYYDKAKHIERNYDFYAQKAIAYVQEHHSLELFKKKWDVLIQKVTEKL